jgi:hypothetical protein
LPKKNKDGTWKPGKWMPKIKGKLKPCYNGYHFCRFGHLLPWLGSTLYEIEVRGCIAYKDAKCLCDQARLLRRVETWDEHTARLFACDCAEHVLHIFEEMYPEDKRPREAIAVARRFAVGEATRDELNDAGDAARAAEGAARAAAMAAWNAAEGAARAVGAAARAAARGAEGAARAAAMATAWSATRVVARGAEGAAMAAAMAAAYSVAWAATKAATKAAAWAAEDAAEDAGDAERVWQIKHLEEMLEE